MATVKDHFLDLERHRRQLEDNVEKLRKALTHWRMCDTEYEELKEEVESVPEPLDRADLDRIRDEFEGQVVTQKEVQEIFGESSPKTKAQIVNILSRRIDYVSKNVQTLEKQLEVAEQKYEKACIVMNPDVRDEDSGLPITDIIEELDDEDNIKSYRLQRPGDVQPQIREALEKAGIKEKDLEEMSQKLRTGADETAQIEDTPVEDVGHQQQQLDEKQPTPSSSKRDVEVDTEPEPEKEPETPRPKKGVSFAEETKSDQPQTTDEDQANVRAAQRLEQIMREAKEIAAPIQDPVIPEDEDEDDAALRREMLRYGMTDIAPIVAELEIDEGSNSEYSEAEFDDDDDDEEDDDDDDAMEDEHGRYKYRVVDDKYRRRMQELEAKLGIKSTREIEDAEAEGKVPDEGIARITVQPAPSPSPTPASQPTKSALKSDVEPVEEITPEETKPKKKKGVKFASALDIAPDTPVEPATSTPSQPKRPLVDPMKGTIVERSPAPQPAAPAPAEPKKASRFKKARTTTTTTSPADAITPPGAMITQALSSRPKGPADAPARFLDADVGEPLTAPSGPEGKTLAPTVVERDTPAGAKEPDAFDASLLHQEAAVEYHRVRNRMIQKQGGFVREEESAIEYPEDEDEGGKRVSRFKAARLARG
ncbi:hypothetical protein VPNG_09095 [Cytospora leucostoma]|uniref:DUF3835 domain-containing protein n=1 Tax=Cytospora leucostoma TaxID=1230097 RepID=A0A423VP68_9PEZI|nr:hypothetical protein VPNG_09095 [Cytospora leucostoma]